VRHTAYFVLSVIAVYLRHGHRQEPSADHPYLAWMKSFEGGAAI
jgi:hypothetical protein